MSRIKWAAISVGGIVAVAHIGVLGHLIRRTPEPKVVEVPTINIPHGPYTSYTIKAGKEDHLQFSKIQSPLLSEQSVIDHLQ
jgi:hypothetical protein